MPKTHVVVDGSNIATEGRTFPSLKQLESALVELRKEMPKAEVTVVVDATFAHRIDPSERKHFEDAQTKGGYITPPAGAIGRGDAFILKIAEKVNAVVLSNDSFQEFHGEHAWLFEPGRLLGASPVPGVGWIFVPRTPVRGPKSRGAVRGVRNLPPMPEPKTPPPRKAKKLVEETVVVPLKKERSIHVKAERRLTASPEPVNDPTTFITFIASHPLGEQIEAEVESFTSHGAIVRFDNVQCYAPLSGLGSPPPRSPREVLERGERRIFVIRGLDPQRRGIELALPDVVQQESTSTAENALPVSEIVEVAVTKTVAKAVRPGKATKKKATAPEQLNPAQPTISKTAAKRAAVKKASPKRAVAKAVVAKKAAPANATKATRQTKQTLSSEPVVTKRAAVKKAPAKRAAAKTAPTKSPATKKAPTKMAVKKTVAKKLPAKDSLALNGVKSTAPAKSPSKKSLRASNNPTESPTRSGASRARR